MKKKKAMSTLSRKRRLLLIRIHSLLTTTTLHPDEAIADAIGLLDKARAAGLLGGKRQDP